MADRERFRLLFGPYQAPPLKRGERATCLYRNCEVVITGWTHARIPWPRCRALGGPGGGSGLLVDEELARAVRHEAAAAVMYWWRASPTAVKHWRKAFGVSHPDGAGTAARTLVSGDGGPLWTADEIALLGAVPDEKVARRTGRTLAAVRLKCGRLGVTNSGGHRWTAEGIALLGTLPDHEVARLVGRSVGAVAQKRIKLGIAGPFDGRRRDGP